MSIILPRIAQRCPTTKNLKSKIWRKLTLKKKVVSLLAGFLGEVAAEEDNEGDGTSAKGPFPRRARLVSVLINRTIVSQVFPEVNVAVAYFRNFSIPPGQAPVILYIHEGFPTLSSSAPVLRIPDSGGGRPGHKAHPAELLRRPLRPGNVPRGGLLLQREQARVQHLRGGSRAHQSGRGRRAGLLGIPRQHGRWVHDLVPDGRWGSLRVQQCGGVHGGGRLGIPERVDCSGSKCQLGKSGDYGERRDVYARFYL